MNADLAITVKVGGAGLERPYAAFTGDRAGLDPKRFNLRTVPDLLSKTDAWEDYCDSERPLDTAIKRLAKSPRKAA